MNPLPVVPNLDVFEDPLYCLLPGFELFQVDEFSLDHAMKRLDARMIKAISFTAHAINHLVLLQLFLVVMRGVWAPTVRMMQYEFCRPLAFPDLL
ncbi:hypothetical protein J2S04_002843 [Alicyclobacillus tengchongensis]|uniref:Uncharacterized protein n=1 Tax=Alicyclobacillus tolerans TaxID=90970 RepID=A0ABT9LZZ8_9BACL|nr:hypothetical protein [Alicyclobacillus tengchongensis]